MSTGPRSSLASCSNWKLEDTKAAGDMGYTMVKVGEGTGGEIMKNPMPNSPSTWVAYVEVDDVAQATTKVKNPWRQGHEGRDGYQGHGVILHHHRSNRSDAWPLAV